MGNLILASTSAIRSQILSQAGFVFQCIPSAADESQIPDTTPLESAQKRARLKSEEVSERHPSAVVIGCDQICHCNNQILHKATTAEQMRERLKLFRTQSHELISAVCLMQNGTILAEFYDSARLYVRSDLTDFDIETYIQNHEQDWRQSAGGYRMEGAGLSLFSHVSGDHYCILGLPIFKLQTVLRQWNIKANT